MSRTGSLWITVPGRSHTLSGNLPYVVRDASLAVVATGTVGRATKRLAPGVYSVTVVTPGGRRTQIAEVRPGSTTPVELPEDEATELLDDEGLWDPDLHGDVVGPLDHLGPAGHEQSIADGDDAAAVLVATERCAVVGRDAHGWVIEPHDNLDAVPTAIFAIAGRSWEMSLPLNPEGREPATRICRVDLVTTGDQAKLVTRFGSERPISRIVEGLLRNNEIASATDLMQQATNLLFHKYADPAGAALGALTLHRYGLAQNRTAWVENLARRFSWLPDGQVLCAALLLKSPSSTKRRRGLDLLLESTTQRPLYTDGLSLALELLRRWPDQPSEAARKERLAVLAGFSANADWDSINLSVEVTEGGA